MYTMTTRHFHRQQGFTFIELVVVIILIGLLSAVALPRFLEVTDDAQLAALQGVNGGFATAIVMAHAQWKADGNRSPAATDPANKKQVNMDGKFIYMNENGWPANTSAALESSVNGQTDAECLEVWTSVLQSSPTATTVPEQRSQFQYFVSLVNDGGIIYCRYEMIIDESLDAVASHYIDYRLENGDVVLHFPVEN
jgi:MSHA pilin protein MshB